MNGFTLNADGTHWWLAPALAGSAATLAATVIVAIPTFAQTVPTPTTPREAPAAHAVLDATTPTTPTTDGNGNCFIYRARWNVALDGARPICNWRG